MPTTPPDEAGGAVAALVERLHARPPLRVWSLIVTVFGDVVAPRGGEVWAGTLADLLGLLRIDAPAVRAALSRLARDGWLDRHRDGRLSHYALSARGRAAFGPALARVYRRRPPGAPPHLSLLVLPDGAERSGLREEALKSGYGALGPGVLVATSDSPPLAALGAAPGAAEDAGVLRLDASLAEGSPRELVARAFDLDPLAARYRAFLADFAPLAEALARGAPLADDQAIVARTLLIHAYRRLILRDPGLPSDWLPPDWPGEAARALTARLYAGLAGPSARWIAAHGRGRDGPLPAPEPGEAARFSAPLSGPLSAGSSD